jgi:hypothetical protein
MGRELEFPRKRSIIHATVLNVRQPKRTGKEKQNEAKGLVSLRPSHMTPRMMALFAALLISKGTSRTFPRMYSTHLLLLFW